MKIGTRVRVTRSSPLSGVYRGMEGSVVEPLSNPSAGLVHFRTDDGAVLVLPLTSLEEVTVKLGLLKVGDIFTHDMFGRNVVIEGGTETGAGKFMAARSLEDGCPGYYHVDTLVQRSV